MAHIIAADQLEYHDFFSIAPRSCLDTPEFPLSFDQSQLSAGQDPFTFPPNPELLGHGSFTSPALLQSFTLNANTLAVQHPYPAQSDQDRFPPFSTNHNPDVWLAEAVGEFYSPSNPPMDSGFNFHDSASFSLPSFEWPAVADDPTPSTAEFLPSLASNDIVNTNSPPPLFPSFSVTSLPEPSQLSDVSVDASLEETVSKELPGPVDVSQPHRMRLPPVTISLKCSACGQIFASRGQLRRHERTHERFLCDIHGCEKSFRMSKDLRRHQATVLHADSRTSLRDMLVCPSCGKRTRRKDAHKRHLATHRERMK